MSTAPYSQDGDLEQRADRQADAMKAQLREDVASWSKARNETSQQLVVPTASPARPPSVPSAEKPRKSKRAASAVKPAPPPDTRPFRMSYDGGTTADYIQYMIDRGAR
jgi:hypothetical protein